MSWDAVVAGGGLAGAAAAARLAMAGRRVLLLERTAGPHDKVCGEFLSHEAAAALAALGLPPARLGAVPIERVRLVAGGIAAATGLPFAAWGLSRRRLDDWLLGQAARHGVTVRRGVTVRGLAADGAGVRLTAGGAAWAATAALLATGKHDLRGWHRAEPSRLLGLKLHLRLADAQKRALDGHVELALFAGGYAGLQPIGDGIANLCLVVSRRRFAALGRDWRRLVAAVPHLARRLAGASAVQAQPLAVAGMPYGFLHAAADQAPVYRLGDQAAVIPSFTGDGMAMALHSARIAADAILAGRTAADYHRELRREFRAPVRLATVVAAVGARAWAQPIMAAACRLAPGLIATVAAQTRATAAT